MENDDEPFSTDFNVIGGDTEYHHVEPEESEEADDTYPMWPISESRDNQDGSEGNEFCFESMQGKREEQNCKDSF